MAKIIKRVGIVFFVLVISFLLLVTCCEAFNYDSNITNSNNNLINYNKINTVEQDKISPIVEEILLDGKTCTEQSIKWGLAIEKSLANGGNQHILVTMYEDWIAPANGILGDVANAFDRGRLYVRPNTYITIDLNGHRLDRKLTTPTENGQVIVVRSATLIIKDSCYDTYTIQNAYKTNPNVDLTSYCQGKITGGNNIYTGGAIHLTDANLIIESGAIVNNISQDSGGGVQAANSTIIMNNGLIANNSSKISGGAINLISESTLNFYGGILYNNRTADGGGIAVSSDTGKSVANIFGGVIAKNSASDDGGGILVAGGGYLNMTGGIIEYNQAVSIDESDFTPCGGAVCSYGLSVVNITGGEFKNNISDCCGGAMYLGSTISTYLSSCLITGNTNNGNKDNVNYGGGVAIRENTCTIGPGTKIYNNTDRGNGSNLTLHGVYKIKISEKLIQDDSITYIGINVVTDRTIDTSLTSGYTSSGNTAAPSRFFFSDVSGKEVQLNSDGEMELKSTGTSSLFTIWWRADEISNYTTGTYLSVPYTGKAYTVRGNDTFITCSNGASGYRVNVSEPGRYVFHSNDTNAKNPYFELIIENPKNQIKKPTIKKYEFVYNNGEQINFEPDGFDSNTMNISYNRGASVGKYTAKVQLKDNWNNVWAGSLSKEDIFIEYEIIHPGIVLIDSSSYDYLYLENGYKKKYKQTSIIHRVNDSDKTMTVNGNVYVIGNIKIGTTLNELINNIRNSSKLIKIYDSNGIMQFDGIESNGVITDSTANRWIATGFKVELYESSEDTTVLDTIYLSVLGDINGDSRITASDVSYLRQVANDSTILESMPIEKRLAGMINNKGGITEVDSEILRNYIDKQIDINKFLESETVNTSTGYNYLTLDRDNMLRKVSDTKTNVIGNISVNTSVEMLKIKLAEMGINISAITIYNRKGEAVNDNTAIVGTGWRIEIGGEVTYLSVLGDLTGDGRITAADISYLRALVVNDTTNVQDCILLSAMILNKGGITTADSEVLKQSINKKTDINKY